METRLVTASRPHSSLHCRRVVFTALSLSIGWGKRGSFGHDAGTMIAGILSAIAVVLASGRDAW